MLVNLGAEALGGKMLSLKKSGETFLTLAWTPLPPSPTALEYRHVPNPWHGAARIAISPGAASCTIDGLLPTATYEVRLMCGDAAVSDPVAFDTLPVGCGGSDGKKGGCVIT